MAHVSEVVWTSWGGGAAGRPGGCEVRLSLLEHMGRSVPKGSAFPDPRVGVEARNATRCVFRHVFPELLSWLVPCVPTLTMPRQDPLCGVPGIGPSGPSLTFAKGNFTWLKPNPALRLQAWATSHLRDVSWRLSEEHVSRETEGKATGWRHGGSPSGPVLAGFPPPPSHLSL